MKTYQEFTTVTEEVEELTDRQISALISKFNKAFGKDKAVFFKQKGMISVDGKLDYIKASIKKMNKLIDNQGK
ncbi:MAG: hypothetical protein WC679_00795 [Bacteroidales bacterium]|jgi:hypothetical protein